MHRKIYEQLADALDRLPNGFPRTESGIELRILQKIFTPAEAELAGQLSGSMEPADVIAARLAIPLQEVVEQLTAIPSMRDIQPRLKAAPLPPTGRHRAVHSVASL